MKIAVQSSNEIRPLGIKVVISISDNSMVILHPLETELIAMLNSSLLNMNQKYKITTTKPQADLQ